MFLYLRQQHVDVLAAVLLPVLKDGFTLVKEQQCIMYLGLPASVSRQLNRSANLQEEHFAYLPSARQMEQWEAALQT